MRTILLLCAFVCLAVGLKYPQDNDSPIWKVFCTNQPIFRGRVDSIVAPGTYSGHVHKVFGGSNFSPSHKNRTPMQEFSITKAAPCTTCSIREVDNSNYWTPDLYYRWDNGTYSLVPNSGLTIYYLSRSGSTGNNRTNPNWQPIPKGLRMLAGDPLRRTWNRKDVRENAVSYVCLNYGGGGFKESGDWAGLATNKCPQGIRAQVWFPMCWDGKNLDSKDHKAHMSYPINGGADPNNGDCPNSHPVRIPGLFYEHLYGVDGFPHGDGKNRFIWANGDPTGFGFHGDFMSGWDPVVMAQAIKTPQCSNSNKDMGFGNNVKACPPLARYVKDKDDGCTINRKIPLTENLGQFRPIKRLPGCLSNNGLMSNCDASPKGSDNEGSYHLYSISAKAYLSVDSKSQVYANASASFLTYTEVWGFSNAPGGKVYIMNSHYNQVVSAQNKAILNNGRATWEQWEKIRVKDDMYAFKSMRTNQYLSVNGDKTLSFSSKNIGNAETFRVQVVDGGRIPEDDGLGRYANGN